MLVRDENSDSGDFDAVEDAVETVGDDGSEQQDMEIDPMLHAVQQWNTRSRRKNTAKAYDPKALEFEEYCCHCYPHEACPTLMTSGKVFFFMLYQFMRAKRPGGSKKRDDSGEYQHFRMAEFMEVSEACQNYVAELRSWTENNRRGEEPIPPEATNPSGHSTYTQYKSALKSLYMAQTARGWEVLAWEQVWSPFTTNLEKLARLRKDRVDRSQFKEKNGSASLMQYHMVQWIPKIEEAMWNKITNFRSALQWMRNRFFFLFTKCAVLRGQTLFNMEISDLAIVSNQNENDLHVMSVLVAQFTTGKTKKDNKASFGRAARHHDVRACPVGGLAFFLALRFFVSREFDHPEFDPRWFVGNENWFRIKLLADPYEFGRGEMATKNIDYSTYYKPVQQVLLDLNMPSNVIAHLGRHLGHRTLEMKEAQDADIDKLGNWNQEKPRSRHYSTNLPITPLRQMAMESQRSKYYVPRTVVMDELEPLLAKTPFSFVYAALQYETELMAENKSTAYLVIRCMAELNIVFLQDAAAMWVKYPERRNHPIYTLPVFREPAWDVSFFRACLISNHSSSLPHFY
jgi:macrodomain Ter protein organizer (MatP/YcbG family)